MEKPKTSSRKEDQVGWSPGRPTCTTCTKEKRRHKLVNQPV